MKRSFEDQYDALLGGASEHLKEEKKLLVPGSAAGAGVVYALGALRSLGQQVTRFVGAGPVLLISDEVLRGLGCVAFAKSILEEAGHEVLVFTDVDPEPDLKNAVAAEALGRAHAVTGVVGIGGGSAMDVAKVVAVGLGLDCSSTDYVTDPASRGRAARLPLFLVPTTAGTGSEVSIFGVICEGKEKRLMADPLLVPDIAILDPLLTVSMPQSVTAATGIDALTHAIEAMTHKNAGPMNDALSLGAISLIGKALKPAVQDPKNLAARYDMLVASALAMMSFNLTGALWAHSVSYIIGMEKPTPHGVGCGLGLPYLLEFNEPACADKHARITQALGLPSRSRAAPTSKLAASVLSLMDDVGLPTTLADWGIEKARLNDLADQTLAMYPREGNPRPMLKPDSRAYWQSMYAGF